MKRKREDEDTDSYFPYKLRCTQDLKNDFMKGYDNFENGETFLHVAIRSKEYDKVKKFIVLFGNTIINKGNNHLTTPLMLASCEGDSNIIEFLIYNGANVHLQDDSGWTALNYSTTTENIEAMETLIRFGISINSLDHFNNTPLYQACEDGHYISAQHLISWGADIEGYLKWNPLLISTRESHKDCVSLLLEYGANPNISSEIYDDSIDSDDSDYVGDTPLHVAVGLERLDLIILIIAAGGHLHSVNPYDETPLSLAEGVSYAYLTLVDTIDKMIFLPNMPLPYIQKISLFLLSLDSLLQAEGIENVSIQELQEAIQERIINILHKANFNSSIQEYQEIIINISNNLNLLATNGVNFQYVEEYLTSYLRNEGGHILNLTTISLSQFSLSELEFQFILKGGAKEILLDQWNKLPYTLQCSGEFKNYDTMDLANNLE
jgi:ankyrin repeat protein